MRVDVSCSSRRVRVTRTRLNNGLCTRAFFPCFSQSRRPAGSSRKQRACHSFRCEAGPLAALVKIAGPLNCDELQELNTLHPRQYVGLDLFTCPGRRASVQPLGAQRTRDPPVAMAPSPRRGPQRIFYFTTLNESSTSSTGGNPSLAGSALFQPGARRSSASYAPSFCVR